MRAISENLAERGREILGVARRDATHGLGDERAIGVVLVRGAPDAQHAAQRVVAVGLAPITQEIPDRIVAPARDLVSRVVGIVLRARAVDPDAGAVPGQIVAIRLSRARILAGAGQALQAVVVIADGAGRGADALLELTQQRLTEAGEDRRVGIGGVGFGVLGLGDRAHRAGGRSQTLIPRPYSLGGGLTPAPRPLIPGHGPLVVRGGGLCDGGIAIRHDLTGTERPVIDTHVIQQPGEPFGAVAGVATQFQRPRRGDHAAAHALLRDLAAIDIQAHGRAVVAQRQVRPGLGCQRAAPSQLDHAAGGQVAPHSVVGAVREGIQGIGQILAAIGFEDYTLPAAHGAGLHPGRERHARAQIQVVDSIWKTIRGAPLREVEYLVRGKSGALRGAISRTDSRIGRMNFGTVGIFRKYLDVSIIV